jgi:hypothetical protein
MFCTFNHETVSAQSVIWSISPAGGVYNIGDTLHIQWATASGLSSSTSVQLGLRDQRYDPNLGMGEGTIVNTTNTGHYDWVIPASYAGVSGIQLGGRRYAIAYYYYLGGDDSFALSPQFTIADTRQLLCEKNIGYTNQTIAPGPVVHKKIGSWNLFNYSNVDSIKVASLQTAINVSAFAVSNVTVVASGVTWGQTTGATPMNNIIYTNFVIAPGAMSTVDIYADFTASSPVSSFVLSLKANAVDILSNVAVGNSTLVSGQLMHW